VSDNLKAHAYSSVSVVDMVGRSLDPSMPEALFQNTVTFVFYFSNILTFYIFRVRMRQNVDPCFRISPMEFYRPDWLTWADPRMLVKRIDGQFRRDDSRHPGSVLQRISPCCFRERHWEYLHLSRTRLIATARNEMRSP
jgi:hypothetical protein